MDSLAEAVATGSLDTVLATLARLGWKPPSRQLPVDQLRTQFMAKVEIDAFGCWVWRGKPTSDGYGRWRNQRAHRAAWELFVGPIPPGMVVDHCRCFRRICVNPYGCLQLVTALRNTQLAIERGQQHPGQRVHHGAKRFCKRGHEFTVWTCYVAPDGRRYCRECRKTLAGKYRRAGRGP